MLMNKTLLRKFTQGIGRLPNLLRGHSLYVNRDKLRLIDHAFSTVFPRAVSFADLGGVWKVHGAYSVHTLMHHHIERGVLIDTDFPQGLEERLKRHRQLEVVRGDFASKRNVDAIGKIDVVYFFDVLLHQANPDWNEVLALYAEVSPCIVIYNQQFTRGEEAIRLTELPFQRYTELVPDARLAVYRYVFDHKLEMHPTYGKPWGDIHNIFQWGITDKALRVAMRDLGYEEVYYVNHGRFSDLSSFENHAFIFLRRGV